MNFRGLVAVLAIESFFCPQKLSGEKQSDVDAVEFGRAGRQGFARLGSITALNLG
jgi:hypothetical protein